MSRNLNSIRATASKMGVITVLGAGIGTAIGAAIGNVAAGVAVGAAVGVAGGALFEFMQRRKRARNSSYK
jgi:hypothetical protein